MSSNHHRKVIDALVLREDRSTVGGVLCNDASGLCLIAKGALRAEDSGVYTNLVRLASQLSPSQRNQQSSLGMATNNHPLISLEMQDSSVLVKEYDGRTVAIRVPSGEKVHILNQDSGASSEG